MFARILFPVDLEEESSWQKAVPAVLGLQQTFGSELHVLTITPEWPKGMYRLSLPPDVEQRFAASAAEGLEAFVREHVPEGIPLTKHVKVGRVYQMVLDTAAEIKADLIVMASHRPDMGDYLIGANASRVVRHAAVSVLVVR
jgi:nucleotide-binding universal stress UspA family protein